MEDEKMANEKFTVVGTNIQEKATVIWNMHLLLREEQTAAYTVEIWKRFRKWGGIPTGITQNVKVRPDRALCKVA